MKTNELKKGQRVLLRSGWEAELLDNKKGTIRDCEVYGDYTECGSVYAHDIVAREIPIVAVQAILEGPPNKTIYIGHGTSPKTQVNRYWSFDIEYTPAQINCRIMNERIFG